MKPLRGMAAVYLREMLILRRRILKQFASWLVSPLLYLVAFHYAMNDTLVGSRPYADFLLPGLVAISSMTQSWAIASDINISRFYWHTFDEFQTAPLHAAAYVTGEVLAGMTRAVLACLVVMGIGLLGGIQIAYGAPGLWLALLLNAWFFSSLAVALALHVKAHADQALLSNFVITPMAFLGGTFFPLDRLPGWAQHVLELLPLPHAAQAMQAAAIGQPVRFLSCGLLFLQCQERTGMNLSGGRCFCLMLGVSLLAHGGLFLNRSPLARLSESKEAPLSLRLAVTPAPPAPTNAAESSPQPPPLAPKEKTPPRPTPQQEPPPPQKRSTHQAKTEKRRTAPQKTATPPEHSRAPQAQSAKAPSPSSPQHTVQPAQGKTEAAAPRHTSFDAVDGPKFLQPPAPRYPRLAQRKGIEGQVLMELMIDAEGRLMSASIKKSGGNGFDEAALEAVRKAIFRPATHNGRPATCIVLLPIHFTLRDAS